MRKLFFLVMLTTFASATAWTTITFFGESVKFAVDHDTNATITVEIPRLPIKAFYPWDASHGMFYMISFVLQVYYVLFSMIHSNLCDVMFCSWLIFACEQLQHLKGIMKPLMELSASLDTYRPNSAALFRSLSANSKSELIHNEGAYSMWNYRKSTNCISSLTFSTCRKGYHQRHGHIGDIQQQSRLGRTVPGTIDAAVLQWRHQWRRGR